MFTDPAGPIQYFSWGRFVIAGQEHGGKGLQTSGEGKDIRIIAQPLLVSRWAERRGHELSIDMITGVFNRDIEVLILGLGVTRAIECTPGLIEEIRRRGISVVECHDTATSCRRFNELVRQGRKVALLAHGTC